MKKAKNIILVFIIGIVISCSNEGSDPVPGIPPSSATPIFPDNNTECNEGTILSDNSSEVVFRWTVSANTDSYTLMIKNLDTDMTRSLNSNSNELAAPIQRGAPFSWSVISKSNSSSQTAESVVWKFYNAGLPKESHPPFPAEVIKPTSGSSIGSGTITLEWESIDIDNDISSYEILLDTANPPILFAGNAATNSIDVDVASGNIYYWKVITTDAVGNASDSEVFQFRVN